MIHHDICCYVLFIAQRVHDGHPAHLAGRQPCSECGRGEHEEQYQSSYYGVASEFGVVPYGADCLHYAILDVGIHRESLRVEIDQGLNE